MPHPEPVSPREKRRIGRYVVTARLGKGGMGMVYRGFDEALEREVALKTLTMEGTLEEESRKRFAIEAKAAARLQHPNIVTVFELGEDRGLPFIAMELLPGVDLDTLLRSGQPLFVEEALDIVAQVCRGLHFAHEHGIVHRDVKPSNIRLLEDGTAKIMDFGIAKLGASGVTKTGMMVGTIHYMSPEQVLGKALDGRSDVWSAGVILYELIAGRRPFQGEAATEVLYRIAHAEPPPLETDAAAEVPRAIELVSRALAKDTARRPTALEMADELASMASERIRAVAVPIPAEALETVNTSRRLLREGRVEEGVQRLRAVAEAHPYSLEARRLLRVATGEMWRRQNAAPAAPEDDFPELAITWQSPPTRVGGDGALPAGVAAPGQGEVAQPGGAGAAQGAGDARGGRTVLWAGAAFAAAAVVAGGILVATRRPPAPAPERPAVVPR
ncbi:MAG TPA: serine/threonine-protein kinase, partial [Vicinamibacteria bacterium]|nr:serine/threonine-protein kinase [Vicinamibacteria bacterium]